jgi:cysteine-rich repeat protein
MVKQLATGALALGVMLLAGGASTADAQATKESLKCADARLKALSKDYGSKYKCYSKAAQKGLPFDPLCLSKAQTKTTEPFAKALVSGGCADDADFFDQNEECTVVAPVGDTIPDGQIGSILNVVNCGYPTISGIDDIIADAIPAPATASKCTAKKVGELGKFVAGIFKCEAKGASKNLPTDPVCINRAITKFNDKVGKEEAKVGNDCQTTGDAEFLSSEAFRTFQRIIPLVPRFDGCGNGLVTGAPFPVENCDDGNTANIDGCPSDCFIDACTPTSNPRPVTLTVSTPNIGAVILELDYPEGKVSLPGLGFEADVTPLIAGIVTPLDFEHAIRLSATDSPDFGQTQVATLNFVDCQGAVAPAVGDFTCATRDAVDGSGTPISATCSVTIP